MTEGCLGRLRTRGRGPRCRFRPSRASGLAAAVNLSEEHRSARETTRDVSVPCVSILTPVSPEILGAVTI